MINVCSTDIGERRITTSNTKSMGIFCETIVPDLFQDYQFCLESDFSGMGSSKLTIRDADLYDMPL